jgi:predicted secreted hydrolase
MRFLLLTCCLIADPVLAAHNSLDAAATDQQAGWWHLTASLADREGRPWQFEWTLYRQAPGAVAVDTGARGEVMVLAHAAILDPDGVYHEQRFTRGEPPRAGDVAAAHAGDRKWVSRGEALLPARLSFSIGDREVNFLLESIDASPAVDIAVGGDPEAGARHYPSQPRVRVRGFVDRGVAKSYLRGQGRFDREWNARALIAGRVQLSAD